MIEIKSEDISIDEVVPKLKAPEIGAVVTYLGTVRDSSADGEKAEQLEFEYHENMQGQLEEVRKESKDKFNIKDVAIIHRVGSLKVRENILLVAVSASHRESAFEACKFIINELKYLHELWRKEKKMKEKIKVTENTILGNVLKIGGAREVLSKYKLPCLTCPMAALEMGKLKLGQVTEAYGIETDKLLKELNNL